MISPTDVEQVAFNHAQLRATVLKDVSILLKVLLVNGILWSVVGGGYGIFWIATGIYKYFTTN
jgi:hypothetical protein